MTRFLENIERFRGTGAANEAGETLEAFLAAYDPKKYDNPCSTVDTLVFARGKEGLEILLVRRRNHPAIGWWALPGGFVEMYEDLEDAAKRELQEETSLTGITVEQLGAYGDVERDPRTRIITTAYMAFVNKERLEVKAGDDAADAVWFKIRTFTAREVAEDTLEYDYTLEGTVDDAPVVLHAVTRKQITGHLIREVHREVLEGTGFLGDHAAIIADGYTRLKSRMLGD